MTGDRITVNFHANPVQKAFIESEATADLFAARMGEGKSAALCWACYRHQARNPGCTWALIRDTWETMRATTLKEFFHWFPPGVFGEWRASDKVFKWTVGGMDNAEVHFLGMDDPADASKLQSRALGGFGIDEPAPAGAQGGVDELVFDVAMSRLREPGVKNYVAKLAENNPDETHWTFRRFVDPGTEGFKVWQTATPENTKNLPPDYYQKLRAIWSHRPDLVTRFVEGEFGFQQEGKAVTPEFDIKRHVALGLLPVRGKPLHLLWDFGLNPTCLISQITPLGQWLFFHALVGDGIGVSELIDQYVAPLLAEEFAGFSWKNIGDPAGKQREQSQSMMSATRMLINKIGGGFIPGPVQWMGRRDPAKAVLLRNVTTPRGPRGMVQIDRDKARSLWLALRGGWHYKIGRTGIISNEPLKNVHSHPGDAFGYGAAVLFPTGGPRPKKVGEITQHLSGPSSSINVSGKTRKKGPLGFERPGKRLPKEARKA